ncbi:MAG: pyruvate kinase, partial [archaeon]|nr:pyruvate kinase [archaeon]
MHRARVVATIGPSSDETTTLTAMLAAGMDVARLNYSHGDLDGKAATIERLRNVEEASGRALGILA